MSYGTTICRIYANIFPNRVRAMIIPPTGCGAMMLDPIEDITIGWPVVAAAPASHPAIQVVRAVGDVPR